MDRIGPTMYPYRIGLSGDLFWSETEKLKTNLKGEKLIELAEISLLTECPDGRVHGSVVSGDEDVHYEPISFSKLALKDRPTLPMMMTRAEDASTNYYDLNPDQIDNSYRDGQVKDTQPLPAPVAD